MHGLHHHVEYLAVADVMIETDPRMVAAEMEMAENEAAHASEEAAVAAKKKAYFRATDNLQYGL